MTEPIRLHIMGCGAIAGSQHIPGGANPDM